MTEAEAYLQESYKPKEIGPYWTEESVWGEMTKVAVDLPTNTHGVSQAQDIVNPHRSHRELGSKEELIFLNVNLPLLGISEALLVRQNDTSCSQD